MGIEIGVEIGCDESLLETVSVPSEETEEASCKVGTSFVRGGDEDSSRLELVTI